MCPSLDPRFDHVAERSRMTLVFYRKRAFENECACTMLWRAFDKTVRRKPLAGAADAGAMGIQSISA
jgi:hypothetical protein